MTLRFSDKRANSSHCPKSEYGHDHGFHNLLTSGEKSEEQDLSGWHGFSYSSNCLESLAEVKSETA